VIAVRWRRVRRGIVASKLVDWHVDRPAKTIVVIDGDPGARRGIRAALRGVYRVTEAATGADGLSAVRRGDIDLVTLESRLHDFGGIDLLAKIKALRPRVPVIMVTAYGSEMVCATALKHGVRAYFPKPIDPNEFFDSVQRILSATHRPSAPRSNVLAGPNPGRAVIAARPTSLEERVHTVADYIENHYGEPVSLRAIAAGLKMSPYALSRAFTAVMKTRFRDRLMHCRVSKAMELLRTSDYSVTEVALMVGFGDLPRFDKVFRKRLGMAPSAYRAATRDRRPASNY
jgi:YesN/AraC family two-component response regulator